MSDLDIFMNAPEGASPEELAAYLDDACAGDRALRERVEALFAADGVTLGPVDHAPQVGEGGNSQQSAPKEVEGSTIGPYKLLQKIGEGGFGTVYMAEQTKPVRRRVALKIIKQGMDTRQVIARFEAERQALAMMEHPNIAKVLDAGATEAGRPYFAMELVRGEPITNFCDEHELHNKQRLELFQDVCSAVGHAHQKGIIHRDLKPTNILVGLDGDRPIVKVIDFGVAKATQLQLTDKTLFTRFEQFIGTPLYISPEQASLSPIDIDTRSDIYSLGVLLYELLTGKPPIDKEELRKAGFDEMRRLIREQEAPKPSTRLSTATEAELSTIAKARHTEPRSLGTFIKGDLDWIVLKALEKDRKRRYETTDAFRKDIEHFLKDELVSATPPSAGYKFQKFARRNRGILLASSAVTLALVAGTIVSTSQWFRAEGAAEQAELEAKAAEEARDAEEAQRTLAEARLRESALSDRVMARDLTANDREPDAMVYLARSSRNDPRATEAYDASIELLQTWNHPRLVTSLKGQLALDGPTESLSWSPTGRTVAGFGSEGQSPQAIGHVWDAETGEVVVTHRPESSDESVGAIGFEPSGNCLMLVWGDMSIPGTSPRIWDQKAGRYRATLAGGAGRYTWPADFSPDGSLILITEVSEEEFTESGGNEATKVGLWSSLTGERLGTLAHPAALRHASFSGDGTMVLSGTHDSTAYVWATSNAQMLRSLTTPDGMPGTLAPDGSFLLADAAVWSQGRDEALLTLEKVARPALDQQQRSITTSGVVGYVDSGGKAARNIYRLETSSQISPDGARYAAATREGVFLWDAETGRLLRELVGPNLIQDEYGQLARPGGVSIQFSPDGLRIAVANRDETRILETRTGELLATVEGGIPRFSPDGKRLMTSNHLIWEWRTRGLSRTVRGKDPRYYDEGTKIIATVSPTSARMYSHPEGTVLANYPELAKALALPSSKRSPDPRKYCVELDRDTIGLREKFEVEGKIPDWWGSFLEFHSQRSFNEAGELARQSLEELKVREEELRESLEGDDSRPAEVARRFLPSNIRTDDDPQRALEADQLIKFQLTKADLEGAYLLDPNHPLIHLELAPHDISPKRARFLARYSLDRLPDDPELQQRAAKAEERFKIRLPQMAAQLGLWEEALREYEALSPQPDSEDDLYRGQLALLAYAASQDPEAYPLYETHCREFLKWAAEAGDPEKLAQAVIASLVLPTRPGSSLHEEALRQAKALGEEPEGSEQKFCLGIVEFRAGNPERAMEWVRGSGPNHVREYALYPLAAMASGDAEAARSRFGFAEKALERARRPHILGASSPEILHGQLILEEARERINDGGE